MQMYLRNYKGKLVFLNKEKYSNEREFYIAIWKIKYNINIAKSIDNTNILEYVNGEKLFV